MTHKIEYQCYMYDADGQKTVCGHWHETREDAERCSKTTRMGLIESRRVRQTKTNSEK